MCADDIPLERLATVLAPIGEFWDELELAWANVVHEVPNIPDGASDYFDAHMRPTLGEVAFQCILYASGAVATCSQPVHEFSIMFALNTYSFWHKPSLLRLHATM